MLNFHAPSKAPRTSGGPTRPRGFDSPSCPGEEERERERERGREGGEPWRPGALSGVQHVDFWCFTYSLSFSGPPVCHCCAFSPGFPKHFGGALSAGGGGHSSSLYPHERKRGRGRGTGRGRGRGRGWGRGIGRGRGRGRGRARARARDRGSERERVSERVGEREREGERESLAGTVDTCHEPQVRELARGKGLDAALASYLVKTERGGERERESEWACASVARGTTKHSCLCLWPLVDSSRFLVSLTCTMLA